MVSDQDMQAIYTATKGKLQISFNYSKEKTGEMVTHTGGVYEVGVTKAGNPCIYMWDTAANDHIRALLLSNINSFEVLDFPFSPNNGWPIKINGEIVG